MHKHPENLLQIDTIFTTYRSDINSTTYVSQLETAMPALVLDGMTLREALDAICSVTGGRYYVDESKNLHYFAAESNAAAWSLSDSPDGATSYGYRNFRRARSSVAWKLSGLDIAILSVLLPAL